MMSGIQTLRDEFQLVGHLELLQLIVPTALMELVCEHLFSQMRVHNPLPTQVEYVIQRTAVCLEARKKRSSRTWHYFTGKGATYYPIAGLLGAKEIMFFNIIYMAF